MGYKYNKWLKEVQDLKNAPGSELFLEYEDFVVGHLETLGLEYLHSKGRETEYSRWAKETFNEALK